jgi:acetylornithine deacetylase
MSGGGDPHRLLEARPGQRRSLTDLHAVPALGHPLVGQLSSAVVAAGGRPPPLAAGVYGSDLRLYTGIGGVPTIHFGPGDMRDAHTPDERVRLVEVVQVARALVVLALRRCGVAA